MRTGVALVQDEPGARARGVVARERSIEFLSPRFPRRRDAARQTQVLLHNIYRRRNKKVSNKLL